MISKDEKALKSLVLLNLLGERGRAVELLRRGMPPAEVCGLLSPSTEWVRNFNPEKEIETCEKLGVRLLSWFDSDYPRLLKEIYDPPLVLYIKGSLVENDQAALAIVGTRRPTFYGRTQTKRFARELAEAGLTIVSGFAKGIDQIAHEAALEVSYGRTIAVLGCGIDVKYPSASEELFERIAERGTVISEFPLGTQPRAEHFPKRNRIISGLSLGVLVVEAALRSGSLISAHEAAEQGREVFAIPGPVDQLTSQGAHKLLKEGAALVETPSDVLEGLALCLKRLASTDQTSSFEVGKGRETQDVCGLFEKKDNPSSFDPSTAQTQKETSEEVLLKALAARSMEYDELAQECLMGPAKIGALLTQLELSGKIRKSHDGRFSLAAR